jgi:hypothetical protein
MLIASLILSLIGTRKKERHGSEQDEGSEAGTA